MSPDAILAEVRRVFREEGRAVLSLVERAGKEYVRAVDLLSDASGRIIVSGVGKSGLIGRKIAGTLTSTGTPATFLHPVEGLHGDLGIVARGDAAILISRSGETEELAGLVDYLHRMGVPIVAITGRPDSSLAGEARVVLDGSVASEACPHNLAPTTSSTVALAIGDALAVALLGRKGFRAEDFAHLHPGGALGRKLSLRVRDVMVSEGYPALPPAATMRECIVLLGRMRGTVPIVGPEGDLEGVVTTGDLTRLMARTPDFLEVPVEEVMTRNPKVARPDELGSAAIHRLETHGIMALPVVDEEGELRGMVHLHDLLRAGAA